MIVCPKCGGTIRGDGCTEALHCENREDWPMGAVPDGPVVLCEEANEHTPRDGMSATLLSVDEGFDEFIR